MRIYDILNPFKLLCETQTLEEALSTDFSIGFELEGVCTRDGFNYGDLPSYHSRREPRGVVKELFDDLNKELGFDKGKIESDSSLHPSDDKGGWTFEYGSPVIKFNPSNINKIYNFLKKLPSLQVYTNESCGFHTHMSFEGIDKKNAAWAMCCIAIDDTMLDELKELKTSKEAIPFVTSWSDIKLFIRIKNELSDLRTISDKNTIYKELSRLLGSDDKYNLVRVHPAGTLEWRGPRNFLNGGNVDVIHEYILKVYKIIVKMAKILNSQTWSGNGIDIDRKEFEKYVQVTDTFNSPEQKRLDNKTRNMVERIKDNPMILGSLSFQRINNMFNNDNNLKRFIVNNYRYDSVSNVLYKLNPEIFNFIIKRVFDDNYDFISYISNAESRNYSVVNKLNKENYDRLMPILVNYIMDDSAWISDELIKNSKLFSKENFKYFEKYLGKEDISKRYIKFIIKNANNFEGGLPLEWYQKLLNSKYFYYLKSFDVLPTKIQRMMVRKSPYMVQYIQHIDPQILNTLKAKYPNIEDYVLGEL